MAKKRVHLRLPGKSVACGISTTSFDYKELTTTIDPAKVNCVTCKVAKSFIYFREGYRLGRQAKAA